MFVVSKKFSNIFLTLLAKEFSHSTILPIYKIPFIDTLILKFEFSLAVECIVLKLSSVFLSISSYKSSLACFDIVKELANIDSTIFRFELSFSMEHST